MAGPFAEVIGDPVAHSKSPLIHKYWLDRLAIAGSYRTTQVRREDLPDFLHKRRSDPEWLGCNVTIPHKEAVLSHLDQYSPDVGALGAVNCIVRRGEELVGYNSDVEGVAAALDVVELENRMVGVLGGGGAARAALVYLARREVGSIILLVRNPSKALGLHSLVPSGMLRVASFDEAPRLLPGAAAIINATPLGMRGFAAMPPELLSAVSTQREAVLFDMVYDPLATGFLSAGRAQQIDGLSMLLGQARRAFELFFCEQPPQDDEELRRLLKQD